MSYSEEYNQLLKENTRLKVLAKLAGEENAKLKLEIVILETVIEQRDASIANLKERIYDLKCRSNS
jgi:hypothetical protein